MLKQKSEKFSSQWVEQGDSYQLSVITVTRRVMPPGRCAKALAIGQSVLGVSPKTD
jgi:hypothetical protein